MMKIIHPVDGRLSTANFSESNSSLGAFPASHSLQMLSSFSLRETVFKPRLHAQSAFHVQMPLPTSTDIDQTGHNIPSCQTILPLPPISILLRSLETIDQDRCSKNDISGSHRTIAHQESRLESAASLQSLNYEMNVSSYLSQVSGAHNKKSPSFWGTVMNNDQPSVAPPDLSGQNRMQDLRILPSPASLVCNYGSEVTNLQVTSSFTSTSKTEQLNSTMKSEEISAIEFPVSEHHASKLNLSPPTPSNFSTPTSETNIGISGAEKEIRPRFLSLAVQLRRMNNSPSLRTSAGRIEKRYTCDACQLSFQQKGGLRAHINSVHKQLRPFACTWTGCCKSYKAKGDLNRHIQGMHFKEKPYECTEISCSKKFARKSTLARHVDNVHSKMEQGRMTIE